MDLKKRLKQLRELQADHTRWFSAVEFEELKWLIGMESHDKLLNLSIAKLAEINASLPNPLDYLNSGKPKYYYYAFLPEPKVLKNSGELLYPPTHDFIELRFELNIEQHRKPFWQLNESIQIVVL